MYAAKAKQVRWNINDSALSQWNESVTLGVQGCVTVLTRPWEYDRTHGFFMPNCCAGKTSLGPPKRDYLGRVQMSRPSRYYSLHAGELVELAPPGFSILTRPKGLSFFLQTLRECTYTFKIRACGKWVGGGSFSRAFYRGADAARPPLSRRMANSESHARSDSGHV